MKTKKFNFKNGQRVEYKNSNYTSMGEIVDTRFHSLHKSNQYLIEDYNGHREWYYEEQITQVLSSLEKIERTKVKFLYSYWKLTNFLSEIYTQVIEYKGNKYECIDDYRQIYSPNSENYSPNQQGLLKLI